MCGRYWIKKSEKDERIDRILESLERKGIDLMTGEVRPGDKAAVVANNRHMEPQPFAMDWGYHLESGKLIFNTRSETASEKPLFEDGMRQRRCLVPANRYFEWEKTDNGKQKYAIAPRGEEGFYLAGIYRLEGKQPVFSILTQSPVKEIAFIHDRMPVIIPEKLTREWLDPSCRAEEIIREVALEMGAVKV